MPFSRARACIASMISRDMRSLLDEVGTLDGDVGDREDPSVGGDRHRLLRGADELAGVRAPALLARPRAHAGAPTEEPAEMRRLGQRALAARRGHLEGVALTHVAQLVRDALAEVERDA